MNKNYWEYITPMPGPPAIYEKFPKEKCPNCGKFDFGEFKKLDMSITEIITRKEKEYKHWKKCDNCGYREDIEQ